MKTTKELIRTVPDYPKPGIQYRDITTLLKSAEGFRESVEQIADWCGKFELDSVSYTHLREHETDSYVV